MSRSWTSARDLRAQVQRLWDRGDLARAVIAATLGHDDEQSVAGMGTRPAPRFPLRLTLRSPSSRDLSERFDDVRAWITDVGRTPGVRIEHQRVNHRVLGPNNVPHQAWVETLHDAITITGRQEEAAVLADMACTAQDRREEAVELLWNRPVKMAAHAAVWDRLLDLVDWIEAHPAPGLFLRQVDLPGIDTKLIEQHRSVLGDLFDLTVPSSVVDLAATGVKGFERRYGFRSKPNLVRFRVLDPDRQLLGLGASTDPEPTPGTGTGPLADITVDSDTFARLDPDVGTVFLVENEINFLTFPPRADALVIWVAGFGTERLATARWLGSRSLWYWGDIDTHGFAILDELRRRFPAVESLLMDERTLVEHRSRWVTEDRPETRDLPRLTPAEAALYDGLRGHRFGDSVRLEQERISYQYLVAAINRVRPPLGR